MLSDFAISPALPVGDLARARTFYEGVLGFTPEEVLEGPGQVFYRSGGTTFFIYVTGSAGTNRATAAAWSVTGIADVVAELRSKGVVFEDYDFPGLKTENGIAEVPGGKAAWFTDPEGNILALDELG